MRLPTAEDGDYSAGRADSLIGGRAVPTADCETSWLIAVRTGAKVEFTLQFPRMKGAPAMRCMLVLLLTASSIGSAQLSAASQCPDNHPVVTVRIHDYVHLKSESLSNATEIVTQTYKRVGVGIEWLGVMHPDAGRTAHAPAAEGSPVPIAQLTINILTPAMAKRGHVADGVLGFVAVPPEGGMGRIGYVVYERVREVAAGGRATEGDILGVVIAHDIGRLILGAGSGTHAGLMNRQWERRDLERVIPLALEFTPPEIDRIRTTLERDSSSSPAECLSSLNDVER